MNARDCDRDRDLDRDCIRILITTVTVAATGFFEDCTLIVVRQSMRMFHDYTAGLCLTVSVLVTIFL